MSISSKITLIGFLTMFIVGVSDLIIVGMLTPMAKDIGVDSSLIGQLVTIYAISFALLSPILIRLTRKWNDKNTLIYSLLLFAILAFLTTITKSFLILCIIRIILAGSASLITVKLMAIGAKLVETAKKAKVVANIYVGFSAANILGIPIGTMLASAYSWKIPFYLIGVITFICLGLIICLVPKPQGISINSQDNSTYEINNKKGTILILVFLLIMMTSNSILFTYIEPLVKSGGHSLIIVSIALFLSGIAGVLGSKLGNTLSELWGYKTAGKVIIIMYLLSLTLLLFFTSNVVLVLLSIFIWNLFHWGTNPTVQFALLQFLEGDPSQILSYNISILNLGIGLGSLVGGALFSYNSSFDLSILVAILLALISYVILVYAKEVKIK